MDVRVDNRDIARPSTMSGRAKLKLLVLEADEETLDKIIEAIQMVCAADSEVKQ